MYPSYNLPELHHKYGISSIDFFFDFDYTIVTSGYGWAYIYVNNIDNDSYGLVYVDSECGGYDEFSVVNVNEGYCGYSMIISPNPSSGETILTLEASSKEESIDLNEEWDFEVYDQQQNLKEKFQKNRGNIKVFNVSNWKEGHYFLRAKYKDKYIFGRLIVSKNN